MTPSRKNTIRITTLIGVVYSCWCGTSIAATDDWEEDPPKQTIDTNQNSRPRQSNSEGDWDIAGQRIKDQVELRSATVNLELWKETFEKAHGEIAMGRFKSAVKLLESAKNIVIGSDNAKLNSTIEALVPLYLKLGMFDRRTALITELKKAQVPPRLILEARKVGDAFQTVSHIDNLLIQSRLDEADELCTSLLLSPSRNLSFHERAKVLDRLTRIYYQQKRWKDAKELLAELLKPYANLSVLTNGIADERVYVAYLLADLSLIYMEEKNYSEAEDFLVKALDVLRAIFQSSHPKVIICTSELALLHSRMGKTDVALNEYDRAYSLARKQPLVSMTARKRIAANYALTLRDANQTDKAKSIEAAEGLKVSN